MARKWARKTAHEKHRTEPKLYSDRTFLRRFSGVHKKKNKLDLATRAQNSQWDRLSKGKAGLDFTILGPGNLKWHTSIHVAAALSKTIKEVYLATDPPTQEISLASYDPLFIDTMVGAFYLADYTLKPPFAFRFVEHKDVLNQQPNPNDGSPLILLHLGVYSFGKDLQYEELCEMAFYYMQECLLFSPIGIDTFLELKKRVWDENIDLFNRDPSGKDAEDEVPEMRRLLATYAAFWKPVWERDYPTLWLFHTSPTGNLDEFAFCYREAIKEIGQMTNKVPKMVQASLDQKQTKSNFIDQTETDSDAMEE